MWRPQQQRQKEHQELLKHLKVGDRVMTSGGMLGVIKQVSEKVVLLTTANGAEVEFVRAAIAKVLKEDDNDLSLDNNP
jgi:preprotein translocase subunit YajC